MAGPPVLMAVGRVARAHGVRGRVLVAPYNTESLGLERVSAFWLSRDGVPPRQIAVVRAERANLGYLVALQGIDGRDAADALRGSEILVDRAELPELEADEFYAADLVGFSLVDREGRARGEVIELTSAGKQELLTVRTPQGNEALVPLGLVFDVNEADRIVIIDVPEGLFEVQQPQQPQESPSPKAESELSPKRHSPRPTAHSPKPE